MKRIDYLFCCLLFVFYSLKLNAQISVSGGTGLNPAYTSFTKANGLFAALNASAQTGNNIVVSITGDVLTEDGTNSLNGNSWSSIHITPSGNRTLTGNVSGSYMIKLNGADSVTVDGLNNGSNSLVISNTATGPSGTILFIADASKNIFKNCSLLGSTSSQLNGVIYFSTGTTTGNDDNTISNCIISAAGTNLPIFCIYSEGTSSTVANSGTIINDNDISNYFNAANTSIGVLLATGNNVNFGWSITNNRFFQTATRVYTTANTHYGIYIGSGSGYTIEGNRIGFANANGTGTTNMVGNSVPLSGTFPSSFSATGTPNATRYIAIRGSFAVGGVVSSIQNNTIGGFALYTSSGATTTNGIWAGIYITSGNVNIGTVAGNTIGSTTGTGSVYTCSSTSGAMVAGIYVDSRDNVNIQNNTIGAIDAMGSIPSSCGSITGISTLSTLVDGNFDISGNTVGNSTNPNLRMGYLTNAGFLSNSPSSTLSNATGAGVFKGIVCNGGISGSLNGSATAPNSIRNVTLNSTSANAKFRGIEAVASDLKVVANSVSNITTSSARIITASGDISGIGIFLNGGGSPMETENNTVQNLVLTNAGALATNLAGIVSTGGGGNIRRNKIFNFSNLSTGVTTTTPPSVTGIMISAGSSEYVYNNMISLGETPLSYTSYIGIWNTTNSTPYSYIYNNSVHIGGNATGVHSSFCYFRGSFDGNSILTNMYIRNNIFTNTRSGGTGKHYAIANNFTGAALITPGWTLTNGSFNNILNANSANVGYWSGNRTFASWKSVSGSDATSQSGVTVNYIDAANGDLHLVPLSNAAASNKADILAVVSNDFDGQTRNQCPDLGADEFDNSGLYYWDADMDGYGTPSLATAVYFCSNNPTAGYSADTTDCNDASATMHPNATEICGNNMDDNCNSIPDEGCSLTLNLNVFLEAKYFMTGLMRPTLFTTGFNNHNAVCDSIIIELRNASSPFNTVFSNTVLLYNIGLVSLTYPLSLVGNAYFIVIRSRTGIETWSKLPVIFGANTSFDFTRQ